MVRPHGLRLTILFLTSLLTFKELLMPHLRAIGSSLAVFLYALFAALAPSSAPARNVPARPAGHERARLAVA
jgi:hypothetical protein